MYYLIIASVILLDRITKYFASSKLSYGEGFPVIDNFFSLTYLENRGAAFGMFTDMPVLTVILPVLLIGAAFAALIIMRNSIGPLGKWSLALIVAGGIGNIIDRIAYGYVIDFLDFHIWNPIFNIADVAVCIGCGLLILYVLIFDKSGADSRRKK